MVSLMNMLYRALMFLNNCSFVFDEVCLINFLDFLSNNWYTVTYEIFEVEKELACHTRLKFRIGFLIRYTFVKI